MLRVFLLCDSSGAVAKIMQSDAPMRNRCCTATNAAQLCAQRTASLRESQSRAALPVRTAGYRSDAQSISFEPRSPEKGLKSGPPKPRASVARRTSVWLDFQGREIAALRTRKDNRGRYLATAPRLPLLLNDSA